MNDSITRRQEVLHEIEELWWNQWVVQALPHLVPYRRWKNEHRSLRVNDIVLVLYAKKLGKGDYVLGRVTRIHPDCHGIVRTVTVVFRKTSAREKMLPYVSKALEEIKLGVQRVCVICPVEEQMNTDMTPAKLDENNQNQSK